MLDWAKGIKAFADGIRAVIEPIGDFIQKNIGWKAAGEIFAGIVLLKMIAPLDALLLRLTWLGAVRLPLWLLAMLGLPGLAVGAAIGIGLAARAAIADSDVEGTGNDARLKDNRSAAGLAWDKFKGLYQNNVPAWMPGAGKPGAAGAAGAAAGAGAGGVSQSMLDLAARGEGGKFPGGGYNTWIGGAQGNLTGMTLDELDKAQSDRSAQGQGSDAGRWQITRTTMRDFRPRLGLKGDDKFDEETQQKVAAAILASTHGDVGKLRGRFISLNKASDEEIRKAYDYKEKVKKLSSDLDIPLSGGAAKQSDALSGMQPDFRARLKAMFKDAPSGSSIDSGYRSEAYQEMLRRRPHRPGYVAMGTSPHTRGIAADIHGNLDWFHENAAKYGLRFPMWPPRPGHVNEAWHIQSDPNTKVPVPESPSPEPAPRPRQVMPQGTFHEDMLRRAPTVPNFSVPPLGNQSSWHRPSNQVAMNQNTQIHVHGVDNPQEVAQRVGQHQTRVNSDLLKNTMGAIG